jgi:hypothetical protein
MMLFMRSTVRIDDDLLTELKERARRENLSLTQMLNRTLRAGLRSSRRGSRGKQRFKQRTFSMGVPRIDLSKALAFAAELEDEETLRELMLRK